MTVESLAVGYDFPWAGHWETGALGAGDQRLAEVRAPVGSKVSLLFRDGDDLAWATLPLFDERTASPQPWSGGWVQWQDGELHTIEALIGLEEFISVEATVANDWTFDLTVTNTSETQQLGPGVLVVHRGDHPLLTADQVGLEELQGGDVGALAEDLQARTGLVAMLGPGVWVVHDSASPLFQTGGVAGSSLEILAEDGSPLPLAQGLANETELEVGIYGPGDASSGYEPITPGMVAEFEIEAVDGQLLSMASMFSQSNDVFVGPRGSGIRIEEGDITDQFAYFDAGTELNQEPGFGPDQGPRQTGTNTGEADPDTDVRLLDDGFDYPELTDMLRITVAPAE